MEQQRSKMMLSMRHQDVPLKECTDCIKYLENFAHENTSIYDFGEKII